MRVARFSALARAALAAAPLVLFAAAPVHAQVDSREAIALRNQIYQMQQEIDALRQQVGQGGGGSPTYLGGGYPQQPQYSGGSSNDIVAQLLSRVDALEEQVRQLRGRVDETDNRVQQQGADLSKRIDDLAFQMQNPGAAPPPGAAAPGTSAPPGVGAPGSGAPAPTLRPPPGALGSTRAPAAPPAAPVPRTPEAAMQEGTAALARHDYPAAETAAREVLSKFRTSPRAYDAQYLLAESLAGQRQYPQAAIAYDDAYNRSRKGSHAQDALLGLAGSLTAINEKKAACDTLSKLHAEFPQERADVRQAAATLHQRAACK